MTNCAIFRSPFLIAIVSLAIEAGGAAPLPQPEILLSGKLTSVAGKFMLTDNTSHVVVELRGNGLKLYVGAEVQVKGHVLDGLTPALHAARVVRVNSIIKSGIPTPVPKPKTADRSSPAAIAITGAATAGSLYAAGMFSGDQPVSRP